MRDYLLKGIIYTAHVENFLHITDMNQLNESIPSSKPPTRLEPLPTSISETEEPLSSKRRKLTNNILPEIKNQQSMMSINQVQMTDVKREDNTGDFIKKHLKSNVFGKIDFKNGTNSDHYPLFIRLSDKDNLLQHLKELMLSHWELPDPKLIVSIVGGAKRFQFAKTRMSQLFKEGLLEIATTTGAWVLTPGSNTGVYKMVGDCLKDHLESVGSHEKNQISLIGIVSWGSVFGFNRLEPTSDDLAKSDIPYLVYPISELKPVGETQCLDPNHTHFILVDDGSRGKFGGEIDWRAKFEGFLSQQILNFNCAKGEKYGSVPIVTLLINGGDGCLEAISKSLENGIPLVTIAGSQRAADIVADLHQLMKQPRADKKADEINGIYKKHFSKPPSKNVQDYMKKICEHINKVTIFDFARGLELDRAMLSALFPEETNIDLTKRKSQLQLALAWNRIDFAQDVIFNIGNHDYKELMQQKMFLWEIMIEALSEDKPAFVYLLAENGFDFQAFATPTTIEELYQTVCKKSNSFSRYIKGLLGNIQAGLHKLKKQRHKLKENKVEENRVTSTYLLSVGQLIQQVLGYSYPNIYEDNKAIDGAQQLFFWALLFNRWELSRFFWKCSKDHIAGAIVGAAILRGLSRNSNHQEGIDITALYHQNSLRFEALANGIMEICWEKDRQSTSQMLVRKPQYWGHVPVLEMAHNTEMEEFLAQSACFSKLSKIWRGDIALRVPSWRIFLFSIIPLFLPLLKFVRKSDSEERSDEKTSNLGVTESAGQAQKPVFSVSWTAKEYTIPWWLALKNAFRAPMVKCIHHSIYYCAFLIVYAIFLMTELPAGISEINKSSNETSSVSKNCFNLPAGCFEIITYCFVLTNFLDEIRQIFDSTSTFKMTVSGKMSYWFEDHWNKLDSASYTGFLIAIILRALSRWSETYFDTAFAARVFYCLSFLVYLIRFAQLFMVFEQLGPKIIMIKKMLIDLLFFIVILIIVILAIGVISEAIEHPGAELNINLLWTIFYKRYFQIYGNLFLDTFSSEYFSIILILYCMFVNTLLMNLLIAMFSNTFQSVQAKSQILWKYNYYLVVKEHFDRPHFLFFGSIWKLIGSCRSSDSSNTDFCRVITDEATNDKITKFLKTCMDRYVIQEDEKERQDIVHQTSQTTRRLDSVIAQLENLKSDTAEKQSEVQEKRSQMTQPYDTNQPQKSKPPLEDRIDSIEKNLKTIMDLLTTK